jgi:hypothetical protein
MPLAGYIIDVRGAGNTPAENPKKNLHFFLDRLTLTGYIIDVRGR